jgi:hypothetical protein
MANDKMNIERNEQSVRCARVQRLPKIKSSHGYSRLAGNICNITATMRTLVILSAEPNLVLQIHHRQAAQSAAAYCGVFSISTSYT